MNPLEPVRVGWEYAWIVGLLLFSLWLTPLALLAVKTHRIAEHCRRSGEDEVDVIFSKHPLALSWWRSLLAWIGLTVVWMVV